MQENGVYVSHDCEMHSRWKLNYGIRYNLAHSGKSKFDGLEPRISASFIINNKQLIKIGLSRNKQYLHLLTNGNIYPSLTAWVPASTLVPPKISDQVSLSWTGYVERFGTVLNIEAYYKRTHYLLEYNETLNGDSIYSVENLYVSGDGDFCGLEFMLEKKTGAFQYMAAYTLSKAVHKAKSINNSQPFRAENDIRNVFSLTLNYSFTKRVSFSVLWTYHSGIPYTPIKQFIIVPYANNTNSLVPLYADRNSATFAPVHRLDINLIIKQKNEKRWKSEWHIGIYNLYNRSQIDWISGNIDINGNIYYSGESLLGFVPAVSYKFSF
jgi:hypothetical protein